MSVAGAVAGIYAMFESCPGIALALGSLDPRQGGQHPELMSVQQLDSGDVDPIERATVFIPQGKIGYFVDRITRYLESADQDKPRHSDLLDRIKAIRAASVEAL